MNKRACVDTESLSLYSVGAGSKRWRKVVEAHLVDCPNCTRELAALNTVADRLARVPRRPAPDQWSKIQARLEPRRARRIALPAFARPKAWAAAAGMALVLVFAGLQLAHEPTVRPPSIAKHVRASDADLQQSHVALAWNDPFADSATLAVMTPKEDGGGAR